MALFHSWETWEGWILLKANPACTKEANLRPQSRLFLELEVSMEWNIFMNWYEQIYLNFLSFRKNKIMFHVDIHAHT